ncbi:right-handed parallel beta-helix repeat-containing protein [Tamlana fucoidanivorans]|nr:right-handed parallel beta-helix repeat-containing protein [Tamlana fucoidanivorans]
MVLLTTLWSCNNEDLFIEPKQDDNTEIEKPEDIEEEDGSDEERSTTPCSFTLENLEPNSTVIIDCVLDLKGQTVNLPTNVTLLYEGGDIINGTLNFSDNSTVSGELLDASLTLGGSAPAMKDPVFHFDPKRWGIVEGETTSDIALKNRDILESMMFQVKELGVTTFKIDKMDAYFEVSKVTSTTSNQNFYRSIEAINIPSDFNLIMTDNTILRVFPSTNDSSQAAALLAIREETNVNVTGGVLYGDRDLRKYSKLNAEEGSHLLTIHASNNVVIDGVKMTMGSVGGLFIESIGFSFNPDYNPSNSIIIKNCHFEKNRMIAFALTDGHNILVENNTFIDNAQPSQNSDGGVVGYAMDIEPVRERDPNTGELIYYQRVFDVTIRGNIERGSRNGAFTIYVGDNIIIENNDLESLVGWSYASNSKIRNNTFKAMAGSNSAAILATGEGETVFNNEIYGNTITGYDSGITIYTGKVKVYDNIINDCAKGLFLQSITNMEISNNRITSQKNNSAGITIQLTKADKLNITNNEIDVKTIHLNFVGLNQGVGDGNYKVNVENNSFKSSTSFSDFASASGVIFKNNVSGGRAQIENASNIEIISNIVNSDNSEGIILRGVNHNILISSNTINKPLNFSCIKIPSTTNSNEVVMLNNTCN